MSDIVERLVAASRDERLSTGVLYREAADEIERLRAALAEARQFMFHKDECLAMPTKGQPWLSPLSCDCGYNAFFVKYAANTPVSNDPLSNDPPGSAGAAPTEHKEQL